MKVEDDPNDLAFTRKPGATGTQEEYSFAGALSFARRRYSKDLTACDVAIVGVPLDAGTTGRSGARFGPRGVRQASAMIAWDRIWGWEFDPFDRMAVIDYGDIQFDPGRADQITNEIERQFLEIHKRNIATLMIGGDHFSTYPVLKSLARTLDKPIALIHFDAHSDTWRDDEGRVDHGTMFYHAAKDGVVDPTRSVQIGIRTHNEDTLGFHIVTAEEAVEAGAEKIAEKIKAIVGDAPAYLTFDVDCLDPAYAPGTGTPVAGGLAPLLVFGILRRLGGVNLKGADVVEVAPSYDVSEVTSLNAATIGLHCLALLALAR